MGKANAEPKQISVRLPAALYDELRLDSYEERRSQTKIIIEALVLRHAVKLQQKAKALEEQKRAKSKEATMVSDSV
jgi:hypothetical protein